MNQIPKIKYFYFEDGNFSEAERLGCIWLGDGASPVDY